MRQAGWFFLLLSCCMFTVGCRSGSTIAAEIPPRPPLTVKAEPFAPSGSLVSFLEFSGSLRARQQTELGFLRAGRLDQLYTSEGQNVVSGQVLAEQDRRALLAKRAELMAQLTQAEAIQAEIEAGPRPFERRAAEDEILDLEAQLQLVRTKLERRSVLFQEGAIAREVVDDFATEENRVKARLQAARNRLRDLDEGSRPETVRAAQARTAQLRANLGSLEVELEDTQLRAPYSGRISAKYAEVGTFLQAGTPVLTLVGLAGLEAELHLPPDQVSELSPGRTVELLASGASWSAEVRQVLPVVDLETRTQRVLFHLPSGNGLQPGQLVRYRVEGTDPGLGYWLPSIALVTAERGLFACYTLDSEPDEEGLYTVLKQSVEVLQTDGSRSFVRGTLSGELLVITEGVHRVVPGQKVRRS